MRTLIIGCGYVGHSLALLLTQRGHKVTGIRRDPPREPDPPGVQWVQADITALDTMRGVVEGFDWVVNAVSSSRGGPTEYEAVYRNGNQNLLTALAPSPPKKYVWVSSTSVYGQTDGSVVNEDSATEPSSATGRILTATESILLRAGSIPAIIARVAGIYGPGRGHLLKQYLRGEAAMIGDGERYLNMVHVDDVAGAIAALLERGLPASVYNVADDEPVSELEFFQWLSSRLRKPMPPFAAAQEMKERKRALTSKRVSNAKLKSATHYTFQYPTFREGYAKELEALEDRAR